MLTIGFSTRETNNNYKEHLIKMSGLGDKKIQIIEIINKGEKSLTTCYNEILEQSIYNHVLFLHDDIIIETKNFGSKLLKQFERHSEYGIIGVAGTKSLPTSGQWWENKKKMYGRVAHTHEGKTWLSTYSPDMGQGIEETVIVDGVFFAIDKTKIKAKFNEKVNGFHFYDITFCFENYLQGVKIGVITTIRVNHKSIGMTNEQWDMNRKQFAETFKSNLPIEIKKVLRKGEKSKVLIGCLDFKFETDEGKYIINLLEKLIKENCDVTVVGGIDKRNELIIKQFGGKVGNIKEPPGFKLGDGKWKLKTTNGEVLSLENTLYKLNETDFNVLYLNQKPVADHLMRLYPDAEAICVIHSINKPIDIPVINTQVVKYIAMNEEIKNFLIEDHSININKIELYELEKNVIKEITHPKMKKGPIKIITGWSDRGGSTNAFIMLTNALNNAGFDAKLYGPHKWHLDKCKSGIFDNSFSVTPKDRLIAHFVQLPNRPNAGKVILSLHEKNLYEVSKIKPFWDEVVFINERHREYHKLYNGKFRIIPNLKESFIMRDKTGIEKIAGVIGSFDENKQTHLSIERALADGCEKVYLFGQPDGPYFDKFVKPLISDKVIVKGFMNNKQEMYDMLGCVYHSSKSEVACLVKDECESTGVVFKGNEATDNPLVLLTNEEILSKWLKILEL